MSTTTTQDSLSSLIANIDDLPSFPAAIQRATRLAEDPDATAADLAAVIEIEPALTAKILRVTNSAFYGLSRTISTAKDGVLILGFSAIRSLAVALSAMNMFYPRDSLLFRHDEFWLHSVCCALVAQRISRASRLPGVDEAFTAGLLHDIGKTVMDQFAHERFKRLLARQKTTNESPLDIELRLMKTTHSRIGRELTERWDLPKALCEAIGGHHRPTTTGTQPMLAMITAIADHVCTVNGAPSTRIGHKPPPPRLAIKTLGIPARALKAMHDGFSEIRDEAERLITFK